MANFVTCIEQTVTVNGSIRKNHAMNLDLCEVIIRDELGQQPVIGFQFKDRMRYWHFSSEEKRDAQYDILTRPQKEEILYG